MRFGEFQRQATMGESKCYNCGTTKSSSYNYDEFTKGLMCKQCAIVQMMSSETGQKMASLKPEFQESRKRMINNLVPEVASFEEMEPMDTIVWLQAGSLAEYNDFEVYLARFQAACRAK
jgi:hypothetical protein